jgi:hypothetical protein
MKKEHIGFITGLATGAFAIATLAWLHKPTREHIKKQSELAQGELKKQVKMKANAL